MQRNVSDVVLLIGFQMRSVWLRTFCGIFLAGILLFTVYGLTRFATQIKEPLPESGRTEQKLEASASIGYQPSFQSKSTPLASITTSVYQALLHWAIPYRPFSPDELLVSAKPGYRFVVLDMSYRNITTDQDVDAGLLTLTAIVQDECGRVYDAEPLAIASLQREYAFPQHEEQYRRMRGVLKPGEFCRTTIIAFEAPEAVNNFILSMEDGGYNTHKQHKASFTIR